MLNRKDRQREREKCEPSKKITQTDKKKGAD